jgi:hypothetical protein
MSAKPLAALIALLITACDKPAPAPGKPPSPQAPEVDAPAWFAPEQPVTAITLTALGPTLALGDKTVALAPVLANDASPWSAQGQSGLAHAARWHDATLSQHWTIAQGNPTLAADLSTDLLPAQAESEPLTLTLQLPPGQLDLLDDTLHVRAVETQAATHAWTPGWLRWRSGEHTLTFMHAGGERMEVSRDDQGVTLRWTLWQPDAHPLLKGCGERLKSWSLAASWSVTLGDRAPVVASRLPGGYQAALAPAFIDPALTGRKDLKEGAAVSAQDWLARARTLIHGHSASTDPRFGNGGLLGGQLGGTLSAPATIAADLAVQAYIRELPAQTIEIAAEDAAGAHNTLFSGQPDCKHLAPPNDKATPVALALGGVTSKLPDLLTSAPAVGHNLPLTATLPALNGQRSTLTTAALSRASLQNLQRQRGLSWFATPLVASRNPLIAASREALLEPERQGHWTLHAELAAALGEVELLQESETLLFAPVGALMRHWRAAQRVRISPLPDGSWLLHNPGPAIPGFTLISPEATSPTPPPGASDKSTGEGEGAQRWLWLDLPAGYTRLVATAAPLQPVRWAINPL